MAAESTKIARRRKEQSTYIGNSGKYNAPTFKHTKSISDDWEICSWNKRTSTASYRNTPEYLNNQSYQLCSPKQWNTSKTLIMSKHLQIFQSSLENNVQVKLRRIFEICNMCETYQHREDYLEFMWNRCTAVSVIIYTTSENSQIQPEIFRTQ